MRKKQHYTKKERLKLQAELESRITLFRQAKEQAIKRLRYARISHQVVNFVGLPVTIVATILISLTRAGTLTATPFMTTWLLSNRFLFILTAFVGLTFITYQMRIHYTNLIASYTKLISLNKDALRLLNM